MTEYKYIIEIYYKDHKETKQRFISFHGNLKTAMLCYRKKKEQEKDEIKRIRIYKMVVHI